MWKNIGFALLLGAVAYLIFFFEPKPQQPKLVDLYPTTIPVRADMLAGGSIRVALESKTNSLQVLTGPVINGYSAESFTIEGPDGVQQTPVAIRAVAKDKQSRWLFAQKASLQLELLFKESLDRSKIYKVHAKNQPSLRARFDGWFPDLVSDKALGANIAADGASTTIRLFAPRATAVTLYLYDTAKSNSVQKSLPMTGNEDGVWEAILDGDLHGSWYDFRVAGPTGPDGSFYADHGKHVSDPYARVNDGSIGRSRIWRATTPATPLKNGRPAMADVVAYEVHLQDFTDLLPVEADSRSRLPAMHQAGLVNQAGAPIGFDHLKALGVNVVHLMPMQEFLHYPDADWKAAFADDPDMQAAGTATENYQWGYRTTHAFAVESKFRAGDNPGDERDQFRDLVQSFHDAGIAVIIDIVPNHTGENMDGTAQIQTFNGIDRPYYYRTGTDAQHIGPYGNEVKTEQRPMVRRWIIDQALHWMTEFGIDGFRIDLTGQLDEQTLKALMAALPDDAIVYGEPWIDVTDPLIRANPEWDWYKADSPITFFQDDARNALKGSPFKLENKATDRGYAGGNLPDRAGTIKALINDYAEEASSPSRGINYLDIHDNWALADRFASQGFDARQGVDEDHYRIAAGLLLTSMGPVVLHGGSEFMRSKGSTPIGDQVKKAPWGEVQMKGRDDTYNQRTPNQFSWGLVGTTSSTHDRAGMQAWWSGLIKLRLSDVGAGMRRDIPVEARRTLYRFLDTPSESQLYYIIDDRLAVFVNVGDAAVENNKTGLEGVWRQLADGKQINLDGLQDGSIDNISLAPRSMQIWVRR